MITSFSRYTSLEGAASDHPVCVGLRHRPIRQPPRASKGSREKKAFLSGGYWSARADLYQL
jgi:hypothetical protein